MADGDAEDNADRLKSSLWYSIGSIVDAIALDQDLNATPQFIGSLTELVWSQILTSGADLENFAKYTIFTLEVLAKNDTDQSMADMRVEIPSIRKMYCFW
ncbi:hypothetical protein D6C99_08315 [Aureobasidium pullulans]|nr:hypothetical protein D6C99_08315 [Aureobasidium pullulans]